MLQTSPHRLAIVPAPTRTGGRALPQLVLALLLLVAQSGMVLHAVEHQSVAPDAYCALCVAAQSVGDALTGVPPGGAFAAAAVPALAAALVSLPAPSVVPFSARAPPVRS